jgi:hypothetical protein
MKKHSGFGVLDLMITAAIVGAILFFYLKKQTHDDRTVVQTLEQNGIAVPAAHSANPNQGSSGANLNQAVGQAVEDKVNAIQAEHMKQMDCQTNGGKNCQAR